MNILMVLMNANCAYSYFLFCQFHLVLFLASMCVHIFLCESDECITNEAEILTSMAPIQAPWSRKHLTFTDRSYSLTQTHICVCNIILLLQLIYQNETANDSSIHIWPFKLVYELCVRRSLWIYVSSWESSDPNTWTPMLNKSENFLLFPKLWSYIFPTNEIWSNIVSSMIQYIL